jgi:glycerophosphoryl diester phosphodiesterase
MRRTLKVAHRGGAALAPENTLAAFQKALELGADAVELDLHQSKDGALVVMHDPDLVHTTRRAGEIQAFTLAELQTLNAACP